MSLVDLYIQEVGRRLPEKERADISQEIRSMIEDTLEDQAKQQGKAPDDEMIVDVLKKLGPPEKIAASYLPPRYLIGPEWYPHFVTTLQVVLPIVVILAAISMVIPLGLGTTSAQNIAETLGKAISGVFGAVFQAAAIVVLIFAIFQQTAPHLETRLASKAWDPRQMKPGPDPERVKLGEVMVDAIFSLIAIGLFNFYPQLVSVNQIVNGHWVSVPVLTATFFNYLPYWTVLWALQAGLDIFLFSRGRWDALARWGAIALETGTVMLLAWVLSGPAIVALDPQDLTKLGWTFNNPNLLTWGSQALGNAVRIAMGITIVVNIVKIGSNLYHLFLRERLQLAGVTK